MEGEGRVKKETMCLAYAPGGQLVVFSVREDLRSQEKEPALVLDAFRLSTCGHPKGAGPLAGGYGSKVQRK